MKFTIAPMTLGEILARAVSLLFGRLGLFLAIEIIIVTPTLILQLILPEQSMGLYAGLFALPNLLLVPIGTAASLHVIAQEYLGRPVSLGDALKFAMGRYWSLLGTLILAGLGIFAGMLACCIPGIYLAIIWAFWSQVVVMEDLAGGPALGRSKDLASGYFWEIFGVLFVVGLITAIPTVPVVMVLPFALPFQGPPNPANPFAPPELTSYLNFAIVKVLATGLNAVTQLFTIICATLLYFDLRNRKEAFDVGHIVAWMDQVRDWRDEPAPDDAAPGRTAAPETGIKQAGDIVPPLPPPETGIQDPNAPRHSDPLPPP